MLRGFSPSLRKTLADSQIAAVAAVVLVVWSCYWALGALGYAVAASGDPLIELAEYLATAVAIRGIPATPVGLLRSFDSFTLSIITGYVFNAALYFLAAWFLARWAYGSGPFRAMKAHIAIFRRQNVSTT